MHSLHIDQYGLKYILLIFRLLDIFAIPIDQKNIICCNGGIPVVISNHRGYSVDQDLIYTIDNWTKTDDNCISYRIHYKNEYQLKQSSSLISCHCRSGNVGDD